MQEIKGIIYIWIHKISGKSYIGQTTKSLEHRTRMHVNSSRGGTKMPLHLAIKKYGIDAFEIKILGSASDLDSLNILEKHFIQKLNTLSPKGYNLKPGGDNHRQHPETRAKQSLSAKQRIKLQGINQFKKIQAMGWEACRGKPSWNKGKKATDEARKNQSLAHLGKVAWNKGKPMSEEQKEKLRLSKLHISKAVYCAELDKNWISIESCAKEIGISAMHVRRLIKNQNKTKSGLSFALSQ